MNDWILAGVIQQAFLGWMVGFLLGIAVGGLLFFGLPWLFDHVKIIFQ